MEEYKNIKEFERGFKKMIIEEYDESLFISRFEDYKRVETTKNPNGNFSYKGLRFLFEYLDELGDEENPIKLDVISLCCDYSEYKNLKVYLNDYDILTDKEEYALDEEGYKEAIENEISDRTTLIKMSDDLNEGFIIGQY